MQGFSGLFVCPTFWIHISQRTLCCNCVYWHSETSNLYANRTQDLRHGVKQALLEQGWRHSLAYSQFMKPLSPRARLTYTSLWLDHTEVRSLCKSPWCRACISFAPVQLLNPVFTPCGRSRVDFSPHIHYIRISSSMHTLPMLRKACYSRRVPYKNTPTKCWNAPQL